MGSSENANKILELAGTWKTENEEEEDGEETEDLHYDQISVEALISEFKEETKQKGKSPTVASPAGQSSVDSTNSSPARSAKKKSKKKKKGPTGMGATPAESSPSASSPTVFRPSDSPSASTPTVLHPSVDSPSASSPTVSRPSVDSPNVINTSASSPSIPSTASSHNAPSPFAQSPTVTSYSEYNPTVSSPSFGTPTSAVSHGSGKKKSKKNKNAPVIKDERPSTNEASTTVSTKRSEIPAELTRIERFAISVEKSKSNKEKKISPTIFSPTVSNPSVESSPTVYKKDRKKSDKRRPWYDKVLVKLQENSEASIKSEEFSSPIGSELMVFSTVTDEDPSTEMVFHSAKQTPESKSLKNKEEPNSALSSLERNSSIARKTQNMAKSDEIKIDLSEIEGLNLGDFVDDNFLALKYGELLGVLLKQTGTSATTPKRLSYFPELEKEEHKPKAGKESPKVQTMAKKGVQQVLRMQEMCIIFYYRF